MPLANLTGAGRGCAVALFISGAGRWLSLDYWLARRFRPYRASPADYPGAGSRETRPASARSSS
ncbi:hypothetical protein DBO86_03060 [Pseudomonas indoloxydans]|uniref:Uncharacterized protein n=1 Tax=Ectopseudomonas oleovorans TaxID=301 RepID=A0A2T5PRW3_ECTOL|nr:hypothetical protein DBO86_03060 [Pseudomonas indoloxydans]